MSIDIYFMWFEHYIGKTGIKVTFLKNSEIVFIPRQVAEIHLLAGSFVTCGFTVHL